MKGLIIANGKISNYSLLSKLIAKHDFILCADGGLNHIIGLDRQPNLVLGDLDSVSKAGLKYIYDKKIKVEKHPVIKNKTDTELAISWMIDRKFSQITLVGAIGSRLDHTLANIYLLKYIYENEIEGQIVDEDNIVRYTDKFLKVKRNEDYNLSIIPLNQEGCLISLEGFQYLLNMVHIPFGSTLGISNKIVEDTGTIMLDKGEILVIESKD